MSSGTTSTLGFSIINLTNDGFPTVQNDAFLNLLSNAVAGSDGTKDYLDHMLLFANLAETLSVQGESAYTPIQQSGNLLSTSATDGICTLAVQLELSENPPGSAAQAATADEQPQVWGLASVALSQPAPTDIYKIVNFGLALAEIPAGIVISKALWAALGKPLLTKLTQYVQTTIENWAQIDLGDDVASAGTDITETATDVALEVGEETTEVVAEGVAVEVTLDLAAAVPPLAALGLLIAVPMLIKSLEKNFVLHLEIDNATDYDFTWSIPYTYEGAMTAAPSSNLIPKMGRATDSFGDKTLLPVMYQADYSSVNSSGFQGLGFVVNLVPTGAEDQSIALVVSIPWIADNTIWLGDTPASPNWPQIYSEGADSKSQVNVNHGDMLFYAEAGIDALHGDQDEYHVVLRISPL